MSTLNPFAVAVEAQHVEATRQGVRAGSRRTGASARIESGRDVLRRAWAEQAERHAARPDDEIARAMRDESERQRARARIIRAEYDAIMERAELNDGEALRAWRLSGLATLIEERAAFLSMTAGAWDKPVLWGDVQPGGRFHRHVVSTYRHLASTPDFRGHATGSEGDRHAYRAPGIRSDLGLLGYAAEDILADAIEFAYVRAALDAEHVRTGEASGLARAEHAARLAIPRYVAGAPTMPLLRGALYRAIRSVYTRGMGAAGAMLRGRIATVQLDGTLDIEPSVTIEYARDITAARHGAVVEVTRRIRQGDEVQHTIEQLAYGQDADTIRQRFIETGDPELLALLAEADSLHDRTPHMVRLTGEQRARDLASLVDTWPVTHDPAMVTVATMLVDGATVEQIKDAYAEHYGRELTDATLTRWASQLGAFTR